MNAGFFMILTIESLLTGLPIK